MIQLLEPSPGLLSGSTTPLLRGAPAPYRVKSDSLSRRGRALRGCACGSSAVGSRVDPAPLRIKLFRREGADDCVVGDGGEVDVAGVVAPDGPAERLSVVAGVDGGGWGPGGESVTDDHGRGRSWAFARCCRWPSWLVGKLKPPMDARRRWLKRVPFCGGWMMLASPGEVGGVGKLERASRKGGMLASSCPVPLPG